MKNKSNKIPVALIGFGYFGQVYYKYLQNHSKFDLQYIYTRTREANKQCPLLQSILDNKEIKALFIATPICTHLNLIYKGLKANKYVMCEKPINPPSSFEAFQDILINNKNKVLIEYPFYFSKALSQVDSISRKHKLGQLKGMNLTSHCLGKFSETENVYELLGSHMLSILQQFCPLSILEFDLFNILYNKKVPTACIINFKGSTLKGVIDISLNSPIKRREVLFFYDKGTITYNPLQDNTLDVTAYNKIHNKKGKEVIISNDIYRYDESNQVGEAIDCFYDLIRKKRVDNLIQAIEITQTIIRICE